MGAIELSNDDITFTDTPYKKQTTALQFLMDSSSQRTTPRTTQPFGNSPEHNPASSQKDQVEYQHSHSPTTSTTQPANLFIKPKKTTNPSSNAQTPSTPSPSSTKNSTTAHEAEKYAKHSKTQTQKTHSTLQNTQ